jgi:hypothetical protein
MPIRKLNSRDFANMFDSGIKMNAAVGSCRQNVVVRWQKVPDEEAASGQRREKHEGREEESHTRSQITPRRDRAHPSSSKTTPRQVRLRGSEKDEEPHARSEAIARDARLRIYAVASRGAEKKGGVHFCAETGAKVSVAYATELSKNEKNGRMPSRV